jgi:hypothetical protein
MRVATALLAVLSLHAAAQESSPCTLGGTVTDGGSKKPVERARVIATAGSYSVLALTDQRGSFCFAHLAPDNYRLIVQKSGYVEFSHPTTLSVEADGVEKPLWIRLTRYGSISGTVLDSEGEPLPGAVVNVWERTRVANGSAPSDVDSTNADARGTFHFSQLPPGTYYLSVKGDQDTDRRFVFPFVDSRGQMPHEREVETFYATSLTFAAATPIEVIGGQDPNLVLTLRKAHLRRISGRILDPPHTGFLSYSVDTETGSSRGGVIPIASDGSFLKADLPPAKYTLYLIGEDQPIARKDVDLTSGDALDVTLDPIANMTIPVTFRTEGKGPAFRPNPATEGVPAMLVREGTDEAVLLKELSDGTYGFIGVENGIYRLNMALRGQKFYLKEVAYGGETQTGDRIDLRAEKPGGLEITLSPNVAEVQGKVSLKDESDDLTVLLVDGGQIVHQTSTDQKGRFRMPAVAPGKYRLYAIEDFDEDDWGSPQLSKELEKRSIELDLKENEKRQVTLSVISADEWAAALKKLGG